MSLPRNSILLGDAEVQLQGLADSSVDMVLTSPPYFNLREYGVSGQLGAETKVEHWVDALRRVSREVHRVLGNHGTYWLNLGDSYAVHARQGAPRKSLLLAPERLALAMVKDGWVLRNKVVWQKANPMPTSVRDRLACTWEAVYVFSKQKDYFFDLDAIRLPHVSKPSNRHRSTARVRGAQGRGINAGSVDGIGALKQAGRVGHVLGKNPGDVWRIATSNFRGNHRATFPEQLARRAILAGCPEATCAVCKQPWRRTIFQAVGGTAIRGMLRAECACNAPPKAGTILDPFFGAGTTGLAAESVGRDWTGIELNPAYASMAQQRIEQSRTKAAA